MTLSYLTYYLAGLIWGVYTDSFLISTVAFLYFIVLFVSIFQQGTIVTSQLLFFPCLVTTFGIFIGVFFKKILKIPPFLCYTLLYDQVFLVYLLVQFIILHAILCFWELLPMYPFAWAGIIQAVFYTAAIFIFYFLNKYHMNSENNQLSIAVIKTFHFYFIIFILIPIILFTVILSIVPLFNTLWIAIIAFILSFIILVLMVSFL